MGARLLRAGEPPPERLRGAGAAPRRPGGRDRDAAGAEAILRRYFERAARRIEAWRAQLDELGPAPVENGPALALAVDEGLAEAGDAFRDIGDLVQGLPEASPEAFFREGDEIFAGVDARFERVEDVMNLDRLDVPELDRAWQAEPACRRFERG